MSHRNVFYYDEASNLTCVRDPDLGLTYYEYDLADRMISVKNPVGEVSYYEYADCGQVQTEIHGNGTVSYYQHDAAGRTTVIEHRQSDGSEIAVLYYEYDRVGNPLSIVREDGSATYYAYDGIYQLTGEVQLDGEGTPTFEAEYQYDAAHNRTVKVIDGEATYYAYNAANQMVSSVDGDGVTYYWYDGRGNLIHRQTPAGHLYFDYDGENHMVHRAWGTNSHAYYSYDADGKRVRIHPHNVTPTVFIYQGPDMLRLQMEKREDGETVAQYTIGARGGLEAQRRDEDTSVYHFDMLGSTVALTDAEEAVTDTLRYEAWGGVLASTGNTTNRHTWVGRERYIMTKNSDLALLGLRYYMPSVGRFTCGDPWRLSGAGYVYARNSATRTIDPRGLVGVRDVGDWWEDLWSRDWMRAILCPILLPLPEAVGQRTFDCIGQVLGLLDLLPIPAPVEYAIEALDCIYNLTGVCQSSPGALPGTELGTIFDCMEILVPVLPPLPVPGGVIPWLVSWVLDLLGDLPAWLTQQAEQGWPVQIPYQCFCDALPHRGGPGTGAPGTPVTEPFDPYRPALPPSTGVPVPPSPRQPGRPGGPGEFPGRPLPWPPGPGLFPGEPLEPSRPNPFLPVPRKGR